MTNIAEVKWIKIVTDIFDDEKILLIESIPESDSIIVIWFKLLCLAGKQNNSGVFTLNDKIPYTDEMLSTIFRRNINTVRLAMSTFEQFGMIEIVNGVITIPNWGKHQSTDMLQDRRDYMRNYMSDYRGKQKMLTSKLNSKSNVNLQEEDKDKDKDKEDISSDTDKSATDKPIFEKDSKPYKCAEFLAKKLTERIPNKKIPETHLQTWAADFDKANRIDGHSWDDIGEVLTFSQDDSFWQINILSGAKFRKQYDQLYLKMQKES